MKCLVIGFGSIGRRHARVLLEMNHAVAFVTQAQNINFPAFSSIPVAIEKWAPDFVIIASDTRLHASSLSLLADLEFEGATLVEKPFLSNVDDFFRVPTGPVYVGYVLRFHPLICRILELTKNSSIWTLVAYAGQYLPDWRPDRDYRLSYSARSEDGGVIRDLSHELDYTQYLVGSCEKTVVAGGKLSSLEIASEDAATLIAECNRCPLVSIHVNYLDISPSRWMVVNGSMGTLKADFVKGSLEVNGKEITFDIDRDAMIRDQHTAILAGDESKLCSVDEAMSTMKWISAAHQSIKSSAWVSIN